MTTSPTISSTNILYMARRKPAKSQEEDVELTRAIIMKHIGSMDDGFVVDDLDVAVSKDLVTSDASEVGASDAASTGRKSIKEKLKDKGRKMKNKLKSKMKKK